VLAALLSVVGVTAGLAESNMAAYRQVYDSHHLQADCQEPGSAPEPYARTLGNRVWATLPFTEFSAAATVASPVQ